MLETLIELLSKYGIYGVFILAVVEAVFLPVPVETLLVPYLMIHPQKIVLAIIISTLGSVVGAAIGNRVGKLGEKFVLARIINEKKMDISKRYFAKFGVWSIGIAALTPLPYKIFALISGVFGIGVMKVIWVSLMARGTRFSAVCLWVTHFGVNMV